MRIAYVLDQLLPNTEADTEQAINTISALVRQGAEVVLHVPRLLGSAGVSSAALRAHYKVEEELAIEQLWAPLASVRAIIKLLHPLRVTTGADLGNFDIVYTRNLPAVASALASDHRVVYETYRPWPAQYPRVAPAFRLVMGHRGFVGAVLHSQLAKESYAAIGVSDDVLEVVHNGFSPALFEPQLSQASARAALDLPADRFIAVYSGRVSRKKGLDLVLDMARQLPEVLFLLVGSQREGAIEQSARELDNVQVHPWMPFDRVAPFLYAADVLLVPPSLGPLQRSRNTVLPLKLFSYLAAGRPILAPRAPDTAELLRHEETAVLVPADELAAAVAGLRRLREQPELAERLGRKCRQLADGLTWDARGRRLLDFIERRLERMTPSRAA